MSYSACVAKRLDRSAYDRAITEMGDKGIAKAVLQVMWTYSANNLREIG